MSDAWVRRLATAAVLLVDAIAAIVSYIHVETLARTHSQGLLAAVLLPASVDGTVAAASLQMLAAARRGDPASALQRVMLVSGVAATLAANVAYGWAGGVVAAVISGWPAYAFVGVTEMTVAAIRSDRPAAAIPRARGQAASPAAPRGRGSRPGRAVGGQGGRKNRTGDLVAAAVAADPQLTGDKLAAQLSGHLGREVSERTGRRWLSRHAAAVAAETSGG
jgi:hypothetical protein